MTLAELERRVTSLEQQLTELNKRGGFEPPKKDWRKSIGIFGNDETMKAVFDEALKLRERDRAKARRRYANKQTK